MSAMRRAPFSDNPRVGVRGQRTQQRILDASLLAFGEEGYHACSVERITKLARCSRVSFYQYFASKEDVFGQLAGQVARQLSASTEALASIGPDHAGWTVLRAWVARYGEIYARYEPVFHALQTDDALVTDAGRTGEQMIARIHARLTSTPVPSRQLDPLIGLLLECLTHTLAVAGVLRGAAPTGYQVDRVEDAVTDVLHRTLFGALDGVNVRPAAGRPLPTIEFGPTMGELLGGDDDPSESQTPETRALGAMLESGRDVFITRGYHDTRVDDLVAAAGVSHGAFYRYFENKGELARILTARALRAIGPTVLELPDVLSLNAPADPAAVRRWLRRYHAAHAGEAAMLRVWIDAAVQDPALRPEFAPPLDWGRRRMARYLRPRGFGDADMDAVVMVALFGVFGARPRSADDVEAAAQIIECGLLGRDGIRSEHA
jgi:AcrR family transcriptional regulator